MVINGVTEITDVATVNASAALSVGNFKCWDMYVGIQKTTEVLIIPVSTAIKLKRIMSRLIRILKLPSLFGGFLNLPYLIIFFLSYILKKIKQITPIKIITELLAMKVLCHRNTAANTPANGVPNREEKVYPRLQRVA